MNQIKKRKNRILLNFVIFLIADVAKKYFRNQKNDKGQALPKQVKQYLDISINFLPKLEYIKIGRKKHCHELILMDSKDNNKFLKILGDTFSTARELCDKLNIALWILNDQIEPSRSVLEDKANIFLLKKQTNKNGASY